MISLQNLKDVLQGVADKIMAKVDDKQDTIPTYTLAEYETIKNDIPIGSLFNISDDKTQITNAGTNKYSTDEIICGEWIDGKPLYRKVISIPLGASGTRATAYVAGHSSSTLRIQSCITTISDDNHTDGYYFSNSYWTLNNSSYQDGNGGTKITANGQIVITCSDDWRGYTANCIVQYTKTTD